MSALNIQLFENPNGWGPTQDNIPQKFENVPYSPLTLLQQRQQSREQYQQQQQLQQQENFRLGKIADWTAPVNIREQHRRAAISVGATAVAAAAASGGTGGVVSRAAVHQQYQQQQQQKQREEESFNVVSHASTSRKSTPGGGHATGGGGGGGGAWNTNSGRGGSRRGGGGYGRGGRGSNTGYTRGGGGGRGGRGRGRGRGGYYQTQRIVPTSRSVNVKNTWTETAHFDLDQLKKLSLRHTPTVVEEVRECGFTRYYDTTNDFVGLKKRRPLNSSFEKTRFNVTTSDDPVIREIAADDLKNAEIASGFTVYTTDALLTVLMSSVRSVYPWDIILEKNGNQIFLDKRPSDLTIDYLTVNETAKEPPVLDNSPSSMQSLRREAAWVNVLFSEQVLRMKKDDKHVFKHSNPFQQDLSEEKISSVAYRYRRWHVSTELSVVVRSEVDAVTKGSSDQQPVLTSLKSLLEYPAAPTSQNQTYEYGNAGLVDWRSSLDTQRGSVLVTEFKNNSNKMARWIAQAILAGSQQLRLGFISRASPTNTKRHHLVGVERLVPQQFASQMDINMNNMWAIVQNVIEHVRKGEDGRYVLVKEPTKSELNLYLLPEGEDPDEETFDEEDQDVRSVTTGADDDLNRLH